MGDNKELIEAEAEAKLQGQAEIWQYMFGYAESMVLRSAVELRIADTIHSHGHPITLAQIASGVGSSSSSPSPDTITCLSRIMRLLVRKKIFTATLPSDDRETLYGLTHSSTWLLNDAELTLAPMILTLTDPRKLAPWQYLSSCVRDGGGAFKKAHGRDLWEYASIDKAFNRIFNDGMKCTARITMAAILSAYEDGFVGVGTMVDAAGGTGAAMAEIVKAHPGIIGINLDLPHVIATAPVYPGVSHVGGNMFEAIPNADAVFMKWILHDWNDEDCIKILRNCRKAIPKKTGKIIIVDVVLRSNEDDMFDNVRVLFDLAMYIYTSGGKERTELEWKEILGKAGFPRYKIIKIPNLLSIIEAYPE